MNIEYRMLPLLILSQQLPTEICSTKKSDDKMRMITTNEFSNGWMCASKQCD